MYNNEKMLAGNCYADEGYILMLNLMLLRLITDYVVPDTNRVSELFPLCCGL